MGCARGNRGLAGAFALAAAVLVAGCGDSGPATSEIETVGASSTTSTTPLSRTAYVRQADEICAESDAAISAITPGSTAAEQAAATTQELQIVRDELKGLQTLGAPEGAAPDSFLAGLGKVSKQLSRQKLALERGDETVLSSITEDLDAAQASAASAASDYGFRKCGKFSAPSGTPTVPGGNGGGGSAGGTAVPTTTTPVAPAPAPAPTPAPAPAPAPGGTGTPPTPAPTTTSGGGSSGGIGAG